MTNIFPSAYHNYNCSIEGVSNKIGNGVAYRISIRYQEPQCASPQNQLPAATLMRMPSSRAAM